MSSEGPTWIKPLHLPVVSPPRRDRQLVYVRRRQEGDRQHPDMDEQTGCKASHSMQRGERNWSHVSQVS